MPERIGEEFLNEKYPDLQKSPEVESAVKRHEKRTGKKPKNKDEKIETYLNRLHEIFDAEDEDKKERRVGILKDTLHEKFVIKEEEVPESYFKNQQRIAREQGHGDVEINDQMRKQSAEVIIKDQEQSLDAWLDYLGSSDATYPDWLKYWTFRSITQLSQYDKEKHEFKKRSKGTTTVFPDINREALAYVLDAVEKKQQSKQKKGEVQGEPTSEEWEKLLKTQNFAKLYVHAIEKITPASEEEKENIQGEWVKYEHGSDAKPLYESLQGHGTGWCTAGESTAEAQLKMGDFYVFYSKDKQGDNAIPRVAIRMQEGQIAEVRGINADQNLEPAMADIAKEKYDTLPGGDKYEKRTNDMKKLTEIERKFLPIKEEIKQLEKEKADLATKAEKEYLTAEEIERFDELEHLIQRTGIEYFKYENIGLTKEELRFLYEIDGKIEGFGYGKDPRSQEIIKKRNNKKDVATIFDCEVKDVASDINELNDKTIVYAPQEIKVYNGISLYKSFFGISRRKFLQDNLKFIVADANITKVLNGTEKNFGEIEIITGDLFLEESTIESLGNLKKVGGNIDLRGSKVLDLGKLEEVGGNVFIDEDSKLDFSNVKIGGELFRGKHKWMYERNQE